MRKLVVLGLLVLGVVDLPASARADEVPVDATKSDIKSVEQAAPAPGGSITLEDAVKRALARSPSAEVARHEIARSEALAKQARASWLPVLNANGAYTRLDDDRELAGRILQSANQLNGNLQLTVPIVSPRAWMNSARAKDNVGVARAAGVDVQREVAVAAGRAYLTVIAQKRVLNSARRALATARAHESYSTTRFEGGVGNRLDAVRAAQERATAEVRLKNGLAALVRAQESLAIIVGEDRALDAAAPPRFEALPTIEAALGEVTTRRTDVVVGRDRIEVARKAVRDSYVDYLPVLTAVGQPFYQNPPTVTQPQTGWQAQLVLSIPLFDGGLRYGLADERRAIEAQARARLEGVLRQARAEVRIAFDAMRRADEALAGATESVKLAFEALELAQLAYKAGATTNIEVIDAERRAHEAETAAAVAEDASRQARLDLLAACGRFP